MKALVNRKAFSLTDNQIVQIHKKFYELNINRKNFQFAKRKAEKLARVHRETEPVFSPRINAKSKQLDRSQTRADRSKKRTDTMYEYAQKYNEHKSQLKKALSEKEL